MAGTWADAIRVAEAEEGPSENPPGSNCTKYGAEYAGRHGPDFACAPYCAMGVVWVLRRVAAIPASVESAGAWALCDNFRKAGRGIPVPQPGALIAYQGPYYPAGHIGFVARLDPDPSFLWTVEFNTGGPNAAEGDGCYFQRRYIPGSLYGYVMPNYGTVPAPVKEIEMVVFHEPKSNKSCLVPSGRVLDYETIKVLAKQGVKVVTVTGPVFDNVVAR